MSLTKLTIQGFKDSGFIKSAGTFDVQINPASMKLVKGTEYVESKVLGEPQKPIFVNVEASTLTFDIFLDDTGIIASKKGKVKDRINQLEQALYTINGESHEPNYAKIVWGDFTFQGRLTTLDFDYTLFKPDGSPLRVKIHFSFKGHRERKEKKSPDLSRIVTVKAGETIPSLCQEYYEDPSYCTDIAHVNNLVNIRNVKPGTRLLFPPLVRNGRIT